MRLKNTLSNSVLPVVGLLIGFAVWETIGRLDLSPAFPPLTDVLATSVEVWTSERFLTNLQDSLGSVAIALPPTILVGVLVGILVGRYRIAEWALDVYINTFLSIPVVALIPILVLIFGLGRGSILATIFIYTFFVVVVNTSSGVKTTDPNLVEMAKSYLGTERRIVRRIVLPAALPLTLAGVRIATGRAIKGVIIAEQVIGLIGLGGMIQRLGGAFRVEELYATILAIGFLGLISMELVRWGERLAMPWMRDRVNGASAGPAENAA
ncbi:MAG: ABC transporter permease [Acidimicrobiia bacterium]|nr:ABC transporter permease [Acidimicrobiia bacterium]